jgi:nitrate reductase assembly molybdenum cofactor insertion protein NarJ
LKFNILKKSLNLDQELYNDFSELFHYPDSEFADKVKNVQATLNRSYPKAAKILEDFTKYVSNTSLIFVEEIFTRSFDVQAITTLDLGYVLFGDDYKRGELLVNLNREHQNVGNDCGTELSDHLPNVLRLLPKMTDKEIRGELVSLIVLPALKKIISEFKFELQEKKNKVYFKHHRTMIDSSKKYGSIYHKPLLAIYEIIKKDFSVSDDIEEDDSAGFTKTVKTELEIN